MLAQKAAAQSAAESQPTTRACHTTAPAPYTLLLPTAQGAQGEALGLLDNAGTLGWLSSLVATSTITLYGDVTGSATATHLTTICGVPACNVINSYSLVLSATSADIPLTLVLRDSTGSFAATTITATSLIVDTQTLVVDATNHLVGVGTATPALFAEQHVLEQKSRTSPINVQNSLAVLGLPFYPGSIQGNYVGVPYDRDGSDLVIFDASNPCNVNVISTFANTVFPPNVFYQFIASGTQGYIVGASDQQTLTLVSIDLSNITSPQLVNSYISTTSNALIPRVALGTNRVYALDQETLYVFDTNLDLLGSQTVASFPSVGNIAVNFAVAGTDVFIVTSSASSGLLSAYDASNPGVNIPLVGSVQLDSSPTAIALSGSTAFVTTGPFIFAVFGAANPMNSPSLTSVNISNPAAMSIIAATSTHLTSPDAIEIIDNTAYLLDSDTSSIVSFNISNPAQMEYQTTFQDSATLFVGLAANKPYLYVTDFDDLGFLTLNVQPTYLLTVTQDLFVNGVVELAPTTACGGQYKIGGVPVLHTYNGDTLVGTNAGNFLYTSTFQVGSDEHENIFFAPGNTGVGNRALSNLVTGFGNTALGTLSLASSTTSFYATAVGYLSQAGNSSTALGSGAGAQGTNSTAIGANSQTYDDNQIVLGDINLVEVVPGGGGITNLGKLNIPWNNMIGNAIQLTGPTSPFGYVTLQPNELTTIYTLILPLSYGTAGSVLTADGNNPSQLSWTPMAELTTYTIQLYGDVIGSSAANQLNTICGVPACNVIQTYSTVLSANSLDIPNTLVLRDNSGSFFATNITQTGYAVFSAQDGSGNVSVRAANNTTTYTLLLPTAQATGANQALFNNGAGQLSWVTTLTGGIQSLNGLTVPSQYLTTSTQTTTLGWSAVTTATNKLNIPYAGNLANNASGVGLITGADYYNFNSTYTTLQNGTSLDIPNTLVRRDATGSFIATTATHTGYVVWTAQDSSGNVSLRATNNTTTYTLLLPNNAAINQYQVLTNLSASGQTEQLGWLTTVTSQASINLLNTATNCDGINTLVLRDGTGSFIGTTLTLTGNTTLINYGTTSCSTGSGFVFAPTNRNTLMGLGAGNNNILTGTGNTAFGYYALQTITTGYQNTAFGANALAASGSYTNCVAVGYNALNNNTGTANVAVGSGALALNGANGANTAVGFQAANGNVGGSVTAVGYGAAQAAGNNTTAVGRGAFYQGTGINNTAMAVGALAGTGNYSDCVAVGYVALGTNAATGNTAVGSNALATNTSGTGNTALGYYAAKASTGANTTALGYQAFYQGTGQNNTAVGASALAGSGTYTDCVAVGALALNVNQALCNVAVGSTALSQNTTGYYNTAVGYQALQSNIVGQNNTAIGCTALQNATANLMTAIGYGALQAATIDEGHTAVGYKALSSAQGAFQNTAVGAYAMANNAGSSYNVAIGVNAYYGTCTQNVAGNNVAIGCESLSSNRCYTNCVAVGAFALQSNTGFYNVGVGSNAGPSPTSAYLTGNYNTFIGYYAGGGVTSGNNIIVIGANVAGANSPSPATYIGNINGITASGGTTVYCNTNNQLGTSSSSQRYKENIHDLGTLSENIYKLRPVQFNYINDEQKWFEAGLIAEEVEEIYPQIVVYKDGLPETLRYQHLPILMLNEQQKDHARIAQLEAENNLMKARIDDLEMKIHTLIG